MLYPDPFELGTAPFAIALVADSLALPFPLRLCMSLRVYENLTAEVSCQHAEDGVRHDYVAPG